MQAEDLGWYDAGWAYRRAITISLPGDQGLTDFPVGLTLPDGFDFAKAQPDGADLRVTLDDGITTVPYWIETWSAEPPQGRIWMRLPRILPGDTTVWLYYGNRDAGAASDGAATFDFFEDFNHPEPTVSIRVEDALTRAVNWLVRAQDVNPGGGVAKFYYIISDKWSYDDYQEVTGYIIPTIFDLAVARNDPELRRRAIDMADWEVSMQSPAGSWDGLIFNTGEVVRGLVRAFNETGDTRYRESAVKGADWLVSLQEPDGSWVSKSFNRVAHTYDSRVDWALLTLWQVTGTEAYRDAARRNLDWILTQTTETGWIGSSGMSRADNIHPLTHTLVYTVEGLLESGLLLGDQACIEAARRAADGLRAQQRPDGALTGGAYWSDWTPFVTDQCLTGSAQMSVVWSKLHRLTGDPVYQEAAVRMNRYLVGRQARSTNPALDGALPGSDPIDGYYEPDHYLSWATLFLVQALQAQAGTGPDHFELENDGFAEARWDRTMAHGAFQLKDGRVIADGQGQPFGARMRAVRNGAAYPFRDGVIEYRFRGVGGWGESGIMYRATGAEQNTGYMVNPSTFPGWDGWRSLMRFDWSSIVMGRGGEFALETWYTVRVAVHGNRHQIAIDGRPVLDVVDAKYPDGAFGLFTWGASAAEFDDVRIRPFVAVEPSTRLGEEVSWSEATEVRNVRRPGHRYSFPGAQVALAFSALPEAGTTVTVRHHQGPPSAEVNPDPPRGGEYLPVWLEVRPDPPVASYHAEVTFDVSREHDFGPRTHVLSLDPSTGRWVLLPGTFHPDTRTFSFTTTRVAAFAFVNLPGEVRALTLSADPASPRTLVLPGAGRLDDPEAPAGWMPAGQQTFDLYLGLEAGTAVNRFDVALRFDPEMLAVEGIALEASVFAGPDVTNATQAVAAGHLALAVGFNSPTNATVAAGDHLARLRLRVRNPGNTWLAIDGADLSSINETGDLAPVYVTPGDEIQVVSWLGDVAAPGNERTGDGLVNEADLAPWLAAYGSGVPGATNATAPYRPQFDLGPTIDGSLRTAAQPDGRIDFEDLALMAMAYGQPGSGPVTGPGSVPMDPCRLSLEAPVATESGYRLAVTLNGPVADLRALSLGLEVAFGEFLGAEAGTMLTNYTTPIVFKSRGEPGRVSIDLAVLGLANPALNQPGEIAVLHFRDRPVVNLTSAVGRTSANRSTPMAVPAGVLAVSSVPDGTGEVIAGWFLAQLDERAGEGSDPEAGGADPFDVAWTALGGFPTNAALGLVTRPYGVDLQTDARPDTSELPWRVVLLARDPSGAGLSVSNHLHFRFLAPPDTNRIYLARVHLDGRYLDGGADFDCVTNLADLTAAGGDLVLPALVQVPDGMDYGWCEIVPRLLGTAPENCPLRLVRLRIGEAVVRTSVQRGSRIVDEVQAATSLGPEAVWTTVATFTDAFPVDPEHFEENWFELERTFDPALVGGDEVRFYRLKRTWLSR